MALAFGAAAAGAGVLAAGVATGIAGSGMITVLSFHGVLTPFALTTLSNPLFSCVYF
jgi:hypothetical protein